MPRIWPLPGGLILMEAARRPFVANTVRAPKSLLKELQEVLVPSQQPVPTSRDSMG